MGMKRIKATRRMVVLLLMTLLTTAAMVVQGCKEDDNPPIDESIPTYILGEWELTTVSKGFHGKTFESGKDTYTFSNTGVVIVKRNNNEKNLYFLDNGKYRFLLNEEKQELTIADISIGYWMNGNVMTLDGGSDHDGPVYVLTKKL